MGSERIEWTDERSIMKKLKFETNVGHVEIFVKGNDLVIEHAFLHQGKTFTMQINLDKQETKEVFKLLQAQA